MSEAADFEGLLRAALAPVEPPEHLSARLEHALESITTMAAEELHSWERSAMRDPRNWLRPAIALLAGTSAGAALAILRSRSHPGGDGQAASTAQPMRRRPAVLRGLEEMRSQSPQLRRRR